jgi:hypothetical protein
MVISAYYYANDYRKTRQESRRAFEPVGSAQEGPEVGSYPDLDRQGRADRDGR